MHHHAGGLPVAVPLAAIILGACGYVFLASRQRRKGRQWSNWRTASFLIGSTLLALALLPRWLPFQEGDFRQHMLQHLLLGMFAPIGLVMAAPITLVLRATPPEWGRTIARVLGSRALRVVANPVSALVLDLGGMAALYFTPLYNEMMLRPGLHAQVHFHFVAAGCLYTWVIAGPDPAPHRPSVPTRLTVLGVAVLIHSVISQLLYSGTFVVVPAPTAELQHSAELMYYGGDIAEMLLAFALVTTWRPVSRQKRAEPRWSQTLRWRNVSVACSVEGMS